MLLIAIGGDCSYRNVSVVRYWDFISWIWSSIYASTSWDAIWGCSWHARLAMSSRTYPVHYPGGRYLWSAGKFRCQNSQVKSLLEIWLDTRLKPRGGGQHVWFTGEGIRYNAGWPQCEWFLPCRCITLFIGSSQAGSVLQLRVWCAHVVWTPVSLCFYLWCLAEVFNRTNFAAARVWIWQRNWWSDVRGAFCCTDV